MRKIKARPIKRLRFRPTADTVYVYVSPIEAAVMAQERYDEYDRQRTWATIVANLRGIGKYVYGDLCTNSLQGDTCIRTLWNKMPVKREVVPESVAQLCGTDINGQEVFEGDVLIDDAYLFATKVGTCGCITASKNYGDGWFLLTLFINLLEEVMRQLNVEYHRNFRRMLIHEMQHYCIGQEKL